MKKSLNQVYMVILLLSMTGCSLPVADVKSMAIEPEEIIMNDFTVKPVETYPAYYVDPAGRVFGVNEGLSSVEDFDPVLPVVSDNGGDDVEGIFDSFFVSEEVLIFTVTRYFPGDPNVEGDTGENITKNFSQAYGVIYEETKAMEFPAPEHGIFDDSEAFLSVIEFDGEPISSVHRKSDPESYVETFGLVDGMIRADGGYFLHVIEGRGSSRMPGILYWKDGLMRMDHTGKDAGRFWMM